MPAADDATMPLLPPLTPRDALHNLYWHVCDTVLDVYAAFLAFVTQLVTAETLAIAGIAVGAVFAFVFGFADGVDGAGRPHRLVSNINWAWFASVLIFPLCVPRSVMYDALHSPL